MIRLKYATAVTASVNISLASRIIYTLPHAFASLQGPKLMAIVGGSQPAGCPPRRTLHKLPPAISLVDKGEYSIFNIQIYHMNVVADYNNGGERYASTSPARKQPKPMDMAAVLLKRGGDAERGPHPAVVVLILVGLQCKESGGETCKPQATEEGATSQALDAISRSLLVSDEWADSTSPVMSANKCVPVILIYCTYLARGSLLSVYCHLVTAFD
ncbi:hypothetical protein BDZ89DRAFT_1049845 [Hymenopellis radicata]|nr:hypothetical protein BDZ89DRAFT_1049845 [Hymenopellis radicata]